jgi:hypothetical protein
MTTAQPVLAVVGPSARSLTHVRSALARVLGVA